MAEPLKIVLIGPGRLGHAIAVLASQDPSLKITATLCRTSERSTLSCDILIDVSLASAFAANIQWALSLKKPIVIGTTGLSPNDHDLLLNASKYIPIFYAPNFSLGMALMRKLAALTSNHLKNASIDLIETHHAQKKDAPSGSALALAKTIDSPVNIHSLRSGKIIGEHTLLFNTPEERITISHEAHSRDAFARGALAAVRFLSSCTPGLYGMDDLLLCHMP